MNAPTKAELADKVAELENRVAELTAELEAGGGRYSAPNRVKAALKRIIRQGDELSRIEAASALRDCQ